jgi:hypothetical protein
MAAPSLFQVCKYSSDMSTVIALSTTPSYGIFLFDASTGALNSSFYEYSVTSLSIDNTRVPVNVAMSSSGLIYLISTTSIDFSITVFNPSSGSTITPTYYVSYGTSTYNMVAYSAIWTSTYSSVYVGGSF